MHYNHWPSMNYNSGYGPSTYAQMGVASYDSSPYALQKSLQLIEKAVQGEKNDELFYQYLISLAPTTEQKEIIASIRDDERKHYQMFKQIYRDITGQEVQVQENGTFERPATYLDGIVNALFGELKAVEVYRDIRQGLPSRYYRDMLFEIITDEIKHAAKYNYLFTLNRTSMGNFA